MASEGHRFEAHLVVVPACLVACRSLAVALQVAAAHPVGALAAAAAPRCHLLLLLLQCQVGVLEEAAAHLQQGGGVARGRKDLGGCMLWKHCCRLLCSSCHQRGY
jgi:hypothetical protein